MDQSSNAKVVKSSTAFFTQLQEEVKGHISNKAQKRKKANSVNTEAKKVKL